MDLHKYYTQRKRPRLSKSNPGNGYDFKPGPIFMELLEHKT